MKSKKKPNNAIFYGNYKELIYNGTPDQVLVGEIHESPTQLKSLLFIVFRRIRYISYAGDS